MNRGNVYWRVLKIFTIGWALFYLTESCDSNKSKPVNFIPLFKDAIKAVDPLEILKDETPSNLADF